MTAISKIFYVDKLDNIVNKSINTCHRIIKMNPTDVKTSTYIECGVEYNDKDSKLIVGDHVRISKYENIFAKGYTLHQSGEDFLIKVINDKGEEIVGTFYEKSCKR